MKKGPRFALIGGLGALALTQVCFDKDAVDPAPATAVDDVRRSSRSKAQGPTGASGDADNGQPDADGQIDTGFLDALPEEEIAGDGEATKELSPLEEVLAGIKDGIKTTHDALENSSEEDPDSLVVKGCDTDRFSVRSTERSAMYSATYTDDGVQVSSMWRTEDDGLITRTQTFEFRHGVPCDGTEGTTVHVETKEIGVDVEHKENGGIQLKTYTVPGTALGFDLCLQRTAEGGEVSDDTFERAGVDMLTGGLFSHMDEDYCGNE
jgi:hypothetical protein